MAQSSSIIIPKRREGCVRCATADDLKAVCGKLKYTIKAPIERAKRHIEKTWVFDARVREFGCIPIRGVVEVSRGRRPGLVNFNLVVECEEGNLDEADLSMLDTMPGPKEMPQVTKAVRDARPDDFPLFHGCSYTGKEGPAIKVISTGML